MLASNCRFPSRSHPTITPLQRAALIALLIAVGGLTSLGLTMLTSTSMWVPGVENSYHFIGRQAQMALLGLAVCFALVFVPIDFLRKTAPVVWIATVVALGLCFMPGVGVEIFGSKRWIDLPGLPQIQPSEIAKISIFLCLAAWYARWQTEIRTFWRGFVMPGIIAGIPVGLILLETDAGTAIALAAATGALMFVAGARLPYLSLASIAGLSGAVFFLITDANRWARIHGWLNLDDPALRLGINHQHLRALYALGNGGPEGVGLGNSVEKFGTLTLAHSDFVYPVIGEELGLLGTLGVIILFGTVLLSGSAIALQAKPLFNRLLGLGVTIVLVFPAIMHIAVTTAVMPNDGVPLPFVSYGGTGLVFSFIAVGILCRIHRESVQEVERKEAYPLARQTRLAVKL